MTIGRNTAGVARVHTVERCVMDCEEYRRAHPAESGEAREHLESCPGCRSFRRAWEIIGEYPEAEPRPDFMRGLRAKLTPLILRFAAPLAAAAAALLVAVVLHLRPADVGRRPEAITEEQRELAENLDLLENIDLLRALEFVGDSVSPFMENPK